MSKLLRKIAGAAAGVLALVTLVAPSTASAVYLVPQGGTGIITATPGGVLIGNGTNAFTVTSAGASGQVLTSNGTGVAPTFQTVSAASGFSTTSAAYWFTTKTTDQLAEGSTNLYYTTARALASFISNLAGTSSVSSIISLPNLSLPFSQTTGIVPINRGGTGTSTAPSYGKVLIGDASGNYELMSTTSLGILGGVSSVFGRTGAVTASSGDYSAFYQPIGSYDTFAYPFIGNATSSVLTFSGGANIGNSLTLTGITGSTQCLSVNSSGVVSGTGSACGSGSGSVSSVSGTYPIQTTGTGVVVVSTAFGTTTANVFSALNTFNNPGVGISVASNSSYGIGGQLFAYGSTTNHSTIVGISAGGTNATTTALSSNSAFGYQAEAGDTTGYENAAFGYESMQANTTGTDNSAFGTYSFNGANGSSFNTALGYESMYGNTTGSNNTAAGYQSLLNNTTGTGNTVIGKAAGRSITTGYSNTIIGDSSAGTPSSITTGFGNIALGSNIFFPSATGNLQLNVGNLIYGSLPATTTGFGLPTSGAIGIGSTSPYAELSVQANNGSTNTALFAIGSSTAAATTTLFGVSNTGAITTQLGSGFVKSTGAGSALSIDSTTYAPTTRNINTAYPLIGGGSLASDLSLSLGFGTTTQNFWGAYNNFTSLFATNASTTNATTTNLALIGAASNCNGANALTTNASGVVGCTAQPQGTLTGLSVASTNGFGGSSSGGATPAITITTSVSGLLKGNGTGVTAATAGTDYEVPLTFSTGLTRSTNTVTVNASQNITTLSNLSTAGTLNNTSGGVLYSTATSTATIGSGLAYSGTIGQFIGGSSGTLSVSGLTTSNFASANISQFTNNSNYITLGSLSATSPIFYNSSTGVISSQAATASLNGYLTSTDWNTFNGKQASGNYVTALTGDATASGPGSAALTLATVNSNIGTFNNVTVNAKGLVTAASNIAYDTFGYLFPSNATTSSLTFGGVTITGAGTGCATFTSGALSSTGTACGSGGGGVSSVTGTYPVISSGGTTPAISLAFGTTTANIWSGLQSFTNTGTTTFAGAISIKGWTLATSTTVCLSPNSCQFQASPTASDVAINAAVTYIIGQGGGTVNIQAGQYTLNAPILIAGDGVTLHGDGNNATMLTLKNSFNDYAIKVNDASLRSRLTFEDFGINGNRSNQTTGGCIMASSTARSTFNTLWLDSCYGDAIKLAGLSSGSFGYNNTIENNYIANDNVGIELVNNDENQIFSNTINSFITYGIFDQQGLQNIHDNVFTGVVYNTGIGVYSQYTVNDQIHNNTFDSVPFQAIYLLCSNTQGQHLVTNNYIFKADNSGTGKAAITVDGCARNQISGNYVDATTQAPYAYQEVNNSSIATTFSNNNFSATSSAYSFIAGGNASTTSFFNTSTSTPSNSTYWGQVDGSGLIGMNAPTGYGEWFGVNGTKQLSITGSGVTLNQVTGSTQCLQVNSAGLISGTGSACGAGSGGLATSSPVAAGNVLEYSSAGAGSAFGVATTSVTNGTGISFTGTAGALVGGSNLTITNTGVTSLSAGTGLSVSGTTGAITVSLTNPVPVSLGGTGQAGFVSGNILIGNGGSTLTSQANLTIAQGGTNATSFTTTGNSVYFNGTSLLTAPLTSAVITPFASSTAISAGYASSTAAFFGTLNLPLLTGTQCLHEISGVVSGTGADCGSGGGAVSSVSNSDGTLTISPTTGAVVASLALGHANTWTALQQFNGNASTTGLTVTGGAFLGTSGANVGVGTTSPSKLFTVEGNQSGGIARIQRDFSAVPSNIAGTYDVTLNETGGLQDQSGPAQTFSTENNGNGTYNIMGQIFAIRNGADTTGSLNFEAYSSGAANGTNSLTIDGKTSQVAIGSTTPSTTYCGQIFCLVNPTFAGMQTVAGTGASSVIGLFQSNSSSNVVTIGAASNVPVQLFQNSNVRATIATNGYFGVGTTTPFAQLSVDNSSNTSGSYPWMFEVGSSTSSTHTSLFAINNQGSIYLNVPILATSTAMTVSWAAGTMQTVRIGTSATTIAFTGATAGQSLTLEVCNSGSAASTVTFSGVLWPSATAPTHTTTANKCDLMVFKAGNGTSTTIIYGGFNQNY